MEASCFGFEEDDPVDSNDGKKARPAHFVKPMFRFVCNVQSKSRAAYEAAQNVHSPMVERTVNALSPMPENPVSITQVQELLLQDMSPTRESSFYEELPTEESQTLEESTPVRVRTARRKRQLEEMEGSSVNDENVENVQRTPARVIARPVKGKRPLGEIQNFDDTVLTPEKPTKKKGKAKLAEKTPLRVFTRPARKKKVEEIDNNDAIPAPVAAKPVVKRKGKKEAQNERNEQLINEFAEQMNSKFKAVEDYQLVVE